MTHIFQNIDDILIKSTKGLVDISSFSKNFGSKQNVRDVFNKYRDLYHPPVWFEFSNDEYAQEFLSIKAQDESMTFGNAYGKPASDEDSEMLTVFLYMWCMTENDELAQKMADDYYYSVMKKDFYFNQDKFIKSLIINESNKYIASKPRNKNKDRALAILSATWHRYPAAPQESLCVAVRNHLNGGVSVDRLKKWIKTAGIRPTKPEKYTSFSLVIPDEA